MALTVRAFEPEGIRIFEKSWWFHHYFSAQITFQYLCRDGGVEEGKWDDKGAFFLTLDGYNCNFTHSFLNNQRVKYESVFMTDKPAHFYLWVGIMKSGIVL